MKDFVMSLVLVGGLPIMTYVAHRNWREGKRALSIASLMAGWGPSGLVLVIWLYRLLASLLNISTTLPALLLPLLVGFGVAGLIGWLWLAVLNAHEWLRNKEAHN